LANPRTVGSLYWHTLVYPVKPPILWERAETQEIALPFRGGVGVSVRLPFTRLALVVGKWNSSYDESQALTNAIRGRYLPDEEINWDFVRFGAQDDQH
jgi:hypothetical protein